MRRESLRRYRAYHALVGKNSPPDCFLPLRSLLFDSLAQKEKRAFWLFFFLVDAAGIEPASENPLIKLSTSVFSLLNFPLEPPADRLLARLAI